MTKSSSGHDRDENDIVRRGDKREMERMGWTGGGERKWHPGDFSDKGKMKGIKRSILRRFECRKEKSLRRPRHPITNETNQDLTGQGWGAEKGGLQATKKRRDQSNCHWHETR